MPEFDRERWADPAWQEQAEALELALRFVWACQRQIHRYADGLAGRPTIHWDYPKGIVAPVGTARTYDLYRADGYLVAVLAQQASRWLSRAESVLHVPAGTFDFRDDVRKQIEALRNVYEHWDEHVDSFRYNTPKKRAGKIFSEANPGLKWPGDGWGLHVVQGPRLDSLNLTELFNDLSRAESALLGADRDHLASVGLSLPDGDYKPLTAWEYFVGAERIE